MIVAPDTVLRWQRRRFRDYWTKLSGRPPKGRPPVNAEIKALVAQMAAANPAPAFLTQSRVRAMLALNAEDRAHYACRS